MLIYTPYFCKDQLR